MTLRAQLKRKLLIVWDGAAQHKIRIVREYLDSTKGAVQMALLPAYAPDLNPVECLWAWLKRHALANFSSKPSLDNTCQLMCMWAGVIQVTVPGQFTELIP